MPGPLTGLVVVALEQAVAAPLATRQLADLGARVIKIERPGVGDFARGYDRTVHGQSSHFVWLNRGKESVELDVKEDTEVLRALAARADVFVQNLAPGAAERLGFGAAELSSAFPRLITCDISGYGSDGPYRDRKAYDLLIQSEAGLISITGSPAEPAKVGIAAADIAAGMYAYGGILTALYDRERTGRGSNIEVSMLEALGEWMGFPYYYATYGGSAPERSGVRHATIAPYGAFRAGDGTVIQLGIQNEREWQDFCAKVLLMPHVATNARFVSNSSRLAHRSELDAVIDSVFGGLTGSELVARLEDARIAFGRQRTVAEFAEHPQLRQRDRWRTVSTPGGDVQALLPPATFRGWEADMGPVPALGEHTEAVLRWLRSNGA
ncbi:CaiB/BaiF CoA-transferase family protein [Kutzneria buriramensis]|uniref:Crotonobetainyl-CoA:carnitine CoA-transferase CaiB-like acyl-CoA transferase n=1 Tax=Kutzneria buriramensis TaxID=1045776 RepID=A0A3E0I825_9PSEU|nr:CaiB/BaiF CoA-transferase family protein [Kutzneria buriramensis]REH54295.1 crotonobetainyl-CoA:carnitine CoA-transferase CaiB-like acyl-CoA transferase [Kutzneria buriramensis]